MNKDEVHKHALVSFEWDGKTVYMSGKNMNMKLEESGQGNRKLYPIDWTTQTRDVISFL